MEPGTIRVGIRPYCDLPQAWAALADQDRLRLWFADLDQPWVAAGRGRIDFGDGDFFDVTVHEVIDHEKIEFEWRFLGLGPTARIRWTVRPVADGTEVTVEDRARDRTAAEVDELVAGWTDFFERLSGYLATGVASRYRVRDQIDGSVTLPELPDYLLDPEAIYRWLPIASDGFGPRWFFVVDDEGPRRFRLDDWRPLSGGVAFQVEIPDAADRTSRIRRCAAATTSCTVFVERAGQAWRLSFSHTGWCRLGLPDRQARQLRRRFTKAWVASLEHARALAAPR